MGAESLRVVFASLVALTLLLALVSQTLLLLGTLEMLRRLNLRTRVRWPEALGSPFVVAPKNDQAPSGGHVHYPEMDEQEAILKERKRLEEEMEQDEQRPTLG